jgi:uncharacterized protein YutE (UPF0331/DUF86 family)
VDVNRDFIKKLIKDIMESINIISDYVSKSFEEISLTERYAVRYHIIVIAEALSALALHIVRRFYNVEPESSIHALNILRDKGLLIDEEYKDFVSMFKLRNLLVHRYWIIIDEKIYENIRSDFVNVMNFIRRISDAFKI